MPDWQTLVKGQLGALRLDPEEKDEVIAELAEHLEDRYEALLKQGLAEKDAVTEALRQVGAWQDLRRQIFSAKRREEPMKTRVQQLWVPGFLTLVLSMVVLAILQKLGLPPRFVRNGSPAILLDFPWMLWLFSLPLLGALAAWFSSRAGASQGTVLLASVFPSLALTGAFLLMFPIGFVVERVMGSQGDFSVAAATLLRDTIGWILIPGLALLIGALPTQVLLSRHITSHGVTLN